MNQPLPLWKIEKRRICAGRYLNSPAIVSWNECGVIRAADRETATNKASFAVGSSAVRVSPVDESYRPTSLLDG